jgi:hypothetical protein
LKKIVVGVAGIEVAAQLRRYVLGKYGFGQISGGAKTRPKRIVFDDLTKGFPDLDASAGMNAAGQFDKALGERSVHHLSKEGLDQKKRCHQSGTYGDEPEPFYL